MQRPATLTLLATVLLAAAVTIWLSGWNQSMFLTLNHAGHVLPDALWSNLTLVADTLFAVAVLLIAASFRPIMFNQALLLLLLGGLLVHGFKQGLDVLRPAAVLDRDSFYIIGQVLKNHSFPSGHSFTAMSCAALLFLNIPRRTTAWLMLLIGAAAALSRAMVGAHWPLDILVGSAAGMLTAVFCVYLTTRFRWLRGHGMKLFTVFLLTLASAALIWHEDGYPHTDLLALIAAVSALLTAAVRVWLPLLRMTFQANSVSGAE